MEYSFRSGEGNFLRRTVYLWRGEGIQPRASKHPAWRLGRHICLLGRSWPMTGETAEPLTLFSAEWFLCVASKMVMNCRYWGLVQRPMPCGERIGNHIRKTGKQDGRVSGREVGENWTLNFFFFFVFSSSRVAKEYIIEVARMVLKLLFSR